MDLDDGQSQRFSRLWYLAQLGVAGAGGILTLAWIFLSRINNVVVSKRKVLNNLKILITNGDSKISQELSQLLRDQFKCTVILLSKNLNSIDTFTCDFTNNGNIRRLLSTIWDKYNGIDIVINNEKELADTNEISSDVQEFVLKSGNNIHQYINIITALIPKMMSHNINGRFVTIKHQFQHETSLVSSDQPYFELIDQLKGGIQTSGGSINMATIYCEKESKISTTAIPEIAHQIALAIESGKSQIEIRKSDYFTILLRKFIERTNYEGNSYKLVNITKL